MHNDNILLHNNMVEFTLCMERMVKAGSFLLLLLLFASWARAQNVNIPDANFKAALVGNTTINTNNDTEIQVSEATAFAGALDVSNKSIADLKGVEAFINLTELKCNDNQLTSLNVSSNAALEVLHCYRNQLTSLDLSANVALKTVYCPLNQLTSLDLGENVNLNTLTCQSNKLTQLDISKNTGLQILNCASNPLTTLDTSANTALTTLSCDNTSLTSLDVSSNTALSLLYCHTSQLSSLDLQSNTNLQLLQAYDNQLTALDLSANTALQILQVQKNQLTSLDVRANNHLIKLDCFENSLTSLLLNSGLSALSCYSNQLTHLDLSDNVVLRELYFGFNQLTTVDLSKNTNLKVLYSNDNALTTLDVSANTNLEVLLCPNNQLGELKLNTALKTLTCNNNQLTSLDLSINTALTTLRCSNNQLENLDLSKNTALSWLECESNQLSHLDLRNGNNSNTTIMKAQNNSLVCVVVDDVSGNHSSWLKDAETTYCSDVPSTVTISYTNGVATNQSPFATTVAFSDEVTGFELSDLILTNGTVANLQTTDNIVFTVDVTPLAPGAVTINMGTHKVLNNVGDPNQSAPEFSITYEITPPTVSITSEEMNGTKRSLIPITVVFSEEVIDFEVSDLDLVNCAATNLQTANDMVYTLDLTPVIQGSVEVNLAAETVTDLAGNRNMASAPFRIAYDAPPTAVLRSQESELTNQSTFAVTVTFSEAVKGLELSDMVVSNGTVDHLQTTDNVAYAMNLTPLESGTVTIDLPSDRVTDQTDNANESAVQFSIVYDGTSPTAVISSSEKTKTSKASFSVNVTFSEAVIGFELTDLTVVNGTVTNLETTDNKIFTFDLTVSSEGMVIIDMAANKIEDQAGNGNSAATQFSIEYEVILGLENQQLSISLFPNPSTSQLFIQVDPRIQIREPRLTLTDIGGKQVLDQVIRPDSDGTISIDMMPYPTGLYLLQFELDERLISRKISKL